MLKKKIYFSIVFTLFLSSLSVNAEETFTRHFAENAQISMKIPTGWIIETAKDKYGVFDARDTHVFRYIIVSDEYFDRGNLDTRFQRFLDGISIYDNNYEIIDTGTAMLGKHPSKWVIHSRYYDEKHIKSLNHIVVIDNHEYIIGGFSLAEKFDEHKPLLERIIESSQIEK